MPLIQLYNRFPDLYLISYRISLGFLEERYNKKVMCTPETALFWPLSVSLTLLIDIHYTCRLLIYSYLVGTERSV